MGATRYETANEISKAGWASATTVLLARGDEYADALAGVPLAHSLDAPLLLTESLALNAATKTEITRLAADEVVILGGLSSVSQAVEDELVGMGLTVRRLAGIDRFETAALIAAELFVQVGGFNEAFVVYARNFPDAMAAASYAAQLNIPILLTETNSLPLETADTLTTLGIIKTYAVGGTAVISDSVVGLLPTTSALVAMIAMQLR